MRCREPPVIFLPFTEELKDIYTEFTRGSINGVQDIIRTGCLYSQEAVLNSLH